MAARAGRRVATRFLSVLPELATFIPMAWIYLYNSWRFAYPVGYAGLYSLMAELLARQPFPLPQEIPYYGPGGIPFAYPPAAAYLASLFVGPLRVPMLSYMRWEPAIVCVLAMVGVYLLGRELSGDRAKGLVAAALTFSATTIYEYHATASGSVRGFALLWSVLGACFALKAYGEGRRWLVHAIIAGGCLAMTAMTHLAYAAFLVLGIVLMCLMSPGRRPIKSRLSVLAVVGVAGLVFAAPWWGLVIARYGPNVFIHASTTHSTGGLALVVGGRPLGLVRALAGWYADLGREWWPPSFLGVTSLSLAYGLIRGRWLAPAWAVATVVTLGQSDRFQILLVGFLAGDLLVDIAHMAASRTRWPERLGGEAVAQSAFLVLAIFPTLLLGFRGIQWKGPTLSADSIELGDWIDDHTPVGSRYLYVGGDHDLGEWLPYLAHRTPGVSPWGAEWTGEYGVQLERMDAVVNCVTSRQMSCVDEFIESTGDHIDWLVVPVSDQPWTASDDPSDWVQVFQNGRFRVLQRVSGSSIIISSSGAGFPRAESN